MIHYTTCPICNNATLSKQLTAKDYTVSSEIFEIEKCINCTVMVTQNVPDQQHIGRYYASENYISHSDTKKGIVSKLYHAVRKLTLASKRKLLQQYTSTNSGSVLDIGCGTGAFLNEMRSSHWEITGLEPDANASANALELYKIKTESPEKLFELREEGFDAITMWHVLEHVHALNDYIAQLKKLLHKKGRIFIAVPNYTSYDANHYKEYWAALDVPRHLYHFSPESMNVLIEKHGLELVAIKPMWFDSFYVSMLSEQYANGKGNIMKAFFIGTISNFKASFNPKKCSSIIYVIKHKK